jgi:hypothetical protein
MVMVNLLRLPVSRCSAQRSRAGSPSTCAERLMAALETTVSFNDSACSFGQIESRMAL